MSDKKIYKTTWKVIDEKGKILFEGYYGEANKFLETYNNKDLGKLKLEPFMEVVG